MQFFIAELCCSVVPWVISSWMMSLIGFIMYCVWSMEKISYISCFDLSWSGLALLTFCFDQSEYNKGTKRSDLWKLTDGVHDLNWIKSWIVWLGMLHWQQRHLFSTRPLVTCLGWEVKKGTLIYMIVLWLLLAISVLSTATRSFSASQDSIETFHSYPGCSSG